MNSCGSRLKKSGKLQENWGSEEKHRREAVLLLWITSRRKFFCTNIGKDSLTFLIWHGVALVEVAHRGAELTVRPAKLRNDDFCELRIRIFDFYRELQAFII